MIKEKLTKLLGEKVVVTIFFPVKRCEATFHGILREGPTYTDEQDFAVTLDNSNWVHFHSEEVELVNKHIKVVMY